MGEVFEARHIDLGKPVAIKVMQLGLKQDDANVTRLLREGRAAAAIHHPNVVSILDVGTQEGVPYLVMEFLEGEDLAQLLLRDGPLSVAAAVDVILPVLAGLAAVHSAGIVHRDVKPSNIFLARRHRKIDPVLVDFGISRFVVPGPQMSTGSMGGAGTLHYMAPEQVVSAREVSAKSDQYAVGVMLYECVTGGTPFFGENPYEVLHAIVTAPLVPPTELNPNVPLAFSAVVDRALSRDPAHRFADVKGLAEALLPFASIVGRSHWAAETGEPIAITDSAVATPVDVFGQTSSDPVTSNVPVNVSRSRVVRVAGVLAVAAVGGALIVSRTFGGVHSATTAAASGSTLAPAPPAMPEHSQFAHTELSATPATSLRRADAPAAHESAAPPVAAKPTPHHAPRPATSTTKRGANDVPILEVE